MDSELRLKCLEIFRSTKILGPGFFQVGTSEIHCHSANLLPYLQHEIYSRFFCAISRSTPRPLPQFMEELSAANIGWGSRPKETFTEQPGWYLAIGARPAPGINWLRLYWNVTPQGAVALTEAATAILNNLLVPFRLKVLLDTSVRRRDAAVLYLPVFLWSAARPVVDTVCARLEGTGHIQPDTPLFTKQLSSGVSLAEDPQTGLSFGIHRSGLVAHSLIKSYMRAHDHEDEQWADLNDEFAKIGLSLARPYLNARSRDIYQF